MEDAGSGHASDVVGGRAEDGAVVHLCPRLVAERAASLAAVHQSAVQLPPLGRVVERPQEVDAGRVRVDVAQNRDALLLGDAVDARQVGSAHRSDCEQRSHGVRCHSVVSDGTEQFPVR